MKFAGFADEVSPDLDAQIAATRELGWRGIEMRLVSQDGKSVHFDDVDDAAFERIWEKLQAAGIAVPSYGTQIANWSRRISVDFASDVQELKRIMPRMRKTGTRVARIMSYPNDGWEEKAWRTEVIRRLRELSKMAEDGGVVLGHENCSGYGNLSAQHTLDLLDAIKSPAFKLIFDSGNFWETGYDPFEFYQAVKSQVVHVHVKDYAHDAASPKGWKAVYPGEGEGRVAETVAALKRDGYDGWYSMEPHIAAAVHEGTQAADSDAGRKIYLKFGRMFEEVYRAA
jgi:sugar phosphate isomerase/epimerase